MFKENYNEFIKDLVEATEKISEDDRDFELESVTGWLNAFTKYANAVVHMEIQLPIIYATKEGEVLRDHVEALDSSRKRQHEIAIDACNKINRTCERYGLAPLCNIDTTDRYEVADFVGMVVGELYFSGLGYDLNMADVVREAKKTKKQLPLKTEAEIFQK